MSKFKVGQVWLDRNGNPKAINSINEIGSYPIQCTFGLGYTNNGRYFSEDDDASEDLITLIYDPETQIDNPTRVKQDELTIRDIFAKEAFTLVAYAGDHEGVAAFCYSIADAMLKERAK